MTDLAPIVVYHLDDSATILLHTAKYLLGSYEVHGFLKAEDLLVACAERKPDVLVLDVQMPDVDAFDLLRPYEPLLPPVPLVLFSAKQDWLPPAVAVAKKRHRAPVAGLLKATHDDLGATIAKVLAEAGEDAPKMTERRALAIGMAGLGPIAYGTSLAISAYEATTAIEVLRGLAKRIGDET